MLINIVFSAERTTIDGEDIIALIDPNPWHGERPLNIRVPVFASKDARNLMTTIAHGEIRPQQSNLRTRSADNIAAADAVMADLHFSDHFRQNTVQVFTASNMIEQWKIAIIDRFPIETMHGGIVEIFRLHPPDIVKDLTPLFARVDPELHIARIDGFGLKGLAKRAC